jgi:uncharacterized protein
MAISLYDMSIPGYLQVLDASRGVLRKGVDHGLDLEAIVEQRLRPDMLPFSFQVISVWHHSLGAVRGLRSGEFGPPPAMPGIDYGGLQGLLDQAFEELQSCDRDEIDPLEDTSVIFRMGDFELPFSAPDFILSFSLPNFYFHATTTYDMLRIEGVPLGKRDFLGTLRVAT